MTSLNALKFSLLPGLSRRHHVGPNPNPNASAGTRRSGYDVVRTADGCHSNPLYHFTADSKKYPARRFSPVTTPKYALGGCFTCDWHRAHRSAQGWLLERQASLSLLPMTSYSMKCYAEGHDIRALLLLLFLHVWGDFELRGHKFNQHSAYIFSALEICNSTEMAEILGIVASVAALIQLAHYGEKFAKALLNFSKQNSSPRKEVDRCASQAQDFSDCINMTHFTLERHFANFTKSPLLQYLSSQGILDRILNRSELIEWRLDKATIRVRSLLGGGNAVFNFFKWWYQKDSILDLFPEMDSVKISLQLLVSATQLEVLDMECKDSPWDTGKFISNEKHMYSSTQF
ncbi:hypothetical protein CCUS01_09128 [Colletotrichum cuscutae]|uniref:Uncharacterized protein n=1 Tax=Colletotrichum cuscutae TaxID=1209917 RepID=A0AAI9XT31_9PEZI|nr:hypothetical protein CCUS01_09128 [Colletotrichum cuscutae]